MTKGQGDHKLVPLGLWPLWMHHMGLEPQLSLMRPQEDFIARTNCTPTVSRGGVLACLPPKRRFQRWKH